MSAAYRTETIAERGVPLQLGTSDMDTVSSSPPCAMTCVWTKQDLQQEERSGSPLPAISI